MFDLVHEIQTFNAGPVHTGCPIFLARLCVSLQVIPITSERFAFQPLAPRGRGVEDRGRKIMRLRVIGITMKCDALSIQHNLSAFHAQFF